MRKAVLLLCILAGFVAALFAAPAHALYEWIDDKGNVNITSEPPPPGVKVLREPKEEPKEDPFAQFAPQAPVVSAPEPTSASGPVSSTLPTTAVQAYPEPQTPSAPPAAPFVPAKPSSAFSLGLKVGAVTVAVLLYLFLCYCMYEICEKLHYEKPWHAWVPFLQLLTFTGAANKPWYWLLLLFLPVAGIPLVYLWQVSMVYLLPLAAVSLAVFVYLWVRICDNLDKKKWLGVLSIVPIVNLGLIGYLAFSEQESFA